MGLLKKLVLAFFVSFAMLATAPSAMAAGKVANQTSAETAQALTDTVTAAEETLTAIQNGTDKETTMSLFKKTKQTAKTIESSTVLAQRDRALSKLKKARSAYKKGKTEDAEEYMIKTVEAFIDVKLRYHAF